MRGPILPIPGKRHTLSVWSRPMRRSDEMWAVLAMYDGTCQICGGPIQKDVSRVRRGVRGWQHVACVGGQTKN